MVIVIGASSFIGVYTVEALLDAGYKVLATGRNSRFKKYYNEKNIEYIDLDIAIKEEFDKLPTKGVEACILLAALLPANSNADLNTVENADEYFRVNTLGTINVLEYCRRNDVNRVISSSSYADVSGYWNNDYIIDETTARNFKLSGDHCAYVISKNAATDIMEYYNNQHGMRNIVFRFPPVYGVGPHGTLKVDGKVVKSGIQLFIDKASKGEDIIVYGKDVIRDVVYVKDVAEAFVDALHSNSKGLYNIASGVSVSLYEQAVAIAEVFSQSNNKVNVIRHMEIENNSKSYRISIDKAKKYLGYTPKYSDFYKMMLDWKKEEERGIFSNLF